MNRKLNYLSRQMGLGPRAIVGFAIVLAISGTGLFQLMLPIEVEAAIVECVPPPSGLVGWWPGDGQATDVIGSNDGELKGGASFGTGLVNDGFSLGGYVEVPDSPSLDITGEITVEAWIKPNTVGVTQAVLTKHNSNTNQVSYGMQIQSGGILGFFVSEDGTTNPTGARTKFSDEPVVTPGVFTHVAGTFDPATQNLRLYVNGVEVSSSLVNTDEVDSIFVSTTPVLTGSIILSGGSLGNFFGGIIDEASIYGEALSADEIRAIYESGSAGKCKVQTDTTPPRCEVIGVIGGELHVEVEDGGSGLDAVNVLVDDNAVVTIPSFAAGTNGVVTVVGTKIDTGSTARVQIEVFDVAGNRSECDPLLAELDRSPSSPRFSTYDAIPQVDRYFTISNTGESIITYALLNVNGRWFIMPTLLPYEVKTIDIGSALVAGAKNTVTVWGGGHGSSVMISDVMPTRTNTFAYPDEPLY